MTTKTSRMSRFSIVSFAACLSLVGLGSLIGTRPVDPAAVIGACIR